MENDARSQATSSSAREGESYRPVFFAHLNLPTSTHYKNNKQEELAMGEDIARCPSCSLHLQVVFDPSELRRERVFFFFAFFLRPPLLFANLFSRSFFNNNSRLCRVPPGGFQAALLGRRRHQGRSGRMRISKNRN